MIKAKFKDVLAVKDVLVKISQHLLPFKLSYDLSILYKNTVSESEKYESKRLELLNKYKSSEDDSTAILDDESKKLFMSEISEFLDSVIELEIDKVNAIQVPETVHLNIADMYILEKFIVLS